ncbi:PLASMODESMATA CALLOSE-BINDING PROTEIN 5-like [Ipomoea triloba]|uniref:PLASMODESMATA CALLOSE-BINDING PROTEIN 5-like n=1 Tax=Ipomoea triloba TaxID=35885 RepID=UPI00125DE30D|nr:PLASMODESMATA CALLOSE-BINDING PROTEIN 5-like [Ipomoea triloba]
MPKTFCFSFAFFCLLWSLCAAQGGGGSTGVAVELWCVAKNNAEDAALQSAIDWACGAGGADCAPIQPGGPCYDASDVLRTASFAFNDYSLKHGMTQDSCNFQNTAALTSLNPSFNGCKFPSSFSKGSINGTTNVGLEPPAADISSSSSSARLGRWIGGLTTMPMFFATLLML